MAKTFECMDCPKGKNRHMKHLMWIHPRSKKVSKICLVHHGVRRQKGLAARASRDRTSVSESIANLNQAIAETEKHDNNLHACVAKLVEALRKADPAHDPYVIKIILLQDPSPTSSFELNVVSHNETRYTV